MGSTWDEKAGTGQDLGRKTAESSPLKSGPAGGWGLVHRGSSVLLQIRKFCQHVPFTLEARNQEISKTTGQGLFSWKHSFPQHTSAHQWVAMCFPGVPVRETEDKQSTQTGRTPTLILSLHPAAICQTLAENIFFSHTND